MDRLISYSKFQDSQDFCIERNPVLQNQTDRKTDILQKALSHQTDLSSSTARPVTQKDPVLKNHPNNQSNKYSTKGSTPSGVVAQVCNSSMLGVEAGGLL